MRLAVFFLLSSLVRAQVFTVNQAGSTPGMPTVVDMSPRSASGLSQTYQFTFSDPDGWQDLTVVNVLINAALDGANACYLAYSRPDNVLYLVTDSGSGLLGMPVGGYSSVQNSQCNVSNARASGSGTTLTLTVDLFFRSKFAGNQVFYLAARDSAQNNSGWVTSGVVNIPAAAPGNVTVGVPTPASGAGRSQAFTFRFTSTSLALGVLNVLINSSIDGNHACHIAFVWPTRQLYLVDDAGINLSPAMALGQSSSVSNSQCTVQSSGSSATGSLLDATLTLNISFSPSFAGPRIAYGAARDSAERSSGWQPVVFWQVP
jgi:hypothetical protein